MTKIFQGHYIKEKRIQVLNLLASGSGQSLNLFGQLVDSILMTFPHRRLCGFLLHRQELEIFSHFCELSVPLASNLALKIYVRIYVIVRGDLNSVWKGNEVINYFINCDVNLGGLEAFGFFKSLLERLHLETHFRAFFFSLKDEQWIKTEHYKQNCPKKSYWI